LVVVFATALVSMTIPAPVFACLPYEAASDFSFRDGLNLAVAGHVAVVEDVGEQERARVNVTVEAVIAGDPGPTVEVAMDPDGGCTHPSGEVGDEIVIAAGAPGADNLGSTGWTGGYLSPYNSATWIIGPDGAVQSGPTIDGREFTARAELVSVLSDLPTSSPTLFARPFAAFHGFGLVIAVIVAILVRAYWAMAGQTGG
jgi:hypothetical protein